MGNKKTISKKDKAPTGKMVAWSARTMSQTAVFIVISYMSIFCTDTLGLSPAIVATLLLVSKVFDGFTDVFAGFLVDNTHTKLGKGRPYEIAIIGMWISTLLLFSTPQTGGIAQKSIWVLVTYIFVNSIFGTLAGAGETTYMIRAFGSQKVMAKVATFSGLLSALTGIVVSVTFPMLMGKMATGTFGWNKLVAIYTIPMMVIGMMRFVFVKEEFVSNEDKKAQRIKIKDILTMFKNNRYIWLLAGMYLLKGIVTNLGVVAYYFIWVVGDISKQGIISLVGLIAMLSLIIFPSLMKKYTVSQIVVGSCAVTMIGCIIAFFAGANMMLLSLSAVMGIATFPVSYYLSLFIMNCATYNESKGLFRMEASISAIPNLFNKIGGALGAAIFGILLSWGGYNGTLSAQPESAIMAIRFGYSLLPAIIWGFILVISLLFNNLEKRIPDLQRELDERNNITA